MHARLAEVMDYVEQNRRELLESLTGTPEDRLHYRVTESSWTVAQILEHLRLVEAGVARLIAKRVGQAKDSGVNEEQSTESVMPSFEGKVSEDDLIRLVAYIKSLAEEARP